MERVEGTSVRISWIRASASPRPACCATADQWRGRMSLSFQRGVGGTDGQGEGRFWPSEWVAARADDGPRGKHLVNRGETVGAAALVEEREVLRVAVGRGEEPEHDLGLDEGAFVGGGARAGIEHAQNVAAARVAVRFVFEGRGRPIAWQKSFCGSRAIQPDCLARSKRSTTRTLRAPNWAISECAFRVRRRRRGGSRAMRFPLSPEDRPANCRRGQAEV